MRSKRPPLKEADLFPPVKSWLEERGYTVYSEVTARDTHARADVVGLRSPFLAVVELKTSLSLDLISQAVNWVAKAHYVYVAVPRIQQHNHYTLQLLKREGIGLLEVDWYLGKDTFHANDHWPQPRFHRRISSDLRDALTEHHRHGPPGGNAGGGHITDYKLMMMDVKQHLSFVRKWPGNGHPDGWVSIRELIRNVETYYKNPRQSLAQALIRIEADWCETKMINRELHFRVKDEALVMERT